MAHCRHLQAGLVKSNQWDDDHSFYAKKPLWRVMLALGGLLYLDWSMSEADAKTAVHMTCTDKRHQERLQQFVLLSPIATDWGRPIQQPTGAALTS